MDISDQEAFVERQVRAEGDCGQLDRHQEQP